MGRVSCASGRIGKDDRKIERRPSFSGGEGLFPYAPSAERWLPAGANPTSPAVDSPRRGFLFSPQFGAPSAPATRLEDLPSGNGRRALADPQAARRHCAS
jgi:hypothetical protein